MPLVGNPGHFALESEFRSFSGKWCFGSLRLWVCGQSVGDFEDTVDLASSARWARTFLDQSSARTRGDLDWSAPDFVYDALYGRAMRETVPHHNVGPFLLDDVGEASWRDRATVLVVRRADGKDRILMRDYKTDALCEQLVAQGVIDRVLEHHIGWVSGLERLREPGVNEGIGDRRELARLRIPSGWKVEFNDFFEIMAGDDLKEDLLQLAHERANLLIDLGWHPDFDPSGSYVLYLFRGDFDGTCLGEFRSPDQAEIVREIERLLGSAPGGARPFDRVPRPRPDRPLPR